MGFVCLYNRWLAGLLQALRATDKQTDRQDAGKRTNTVGKWHERHGVQDQSLSCPVCLTSSLSNNTHFHDLSQEMEMASVIFVDRHCRERDMSFRLLAEINSFFSKSDQGMPANRFLGLRLLSARSL